MCFPGGSDGKESACNTGDLDLIPRLGRSSWGENGNPLQYSCLENSMDRGAWQATVQFSSVTQSCLTLWPHELQHTILPCPSSTPGACRIHVCWVCDAIQVPHPLSSPSPPALSLSRHQGLFQWVSSSHQVTKVLEIQLQHQSFQQIQDWLPLGLTGSIFLQSKGLSSLFQHHSSKASILLCSAFFIVQLSHPYMTTGKTIALTRWTFVSSAMSLLFNMLSRLAIAFLRRSKRPLISWLQSPSAVILEPPKIKSVTISTVFPSICHEVMGPDAMSCSPWSWKQLNTTKRLTHTHIMCFTKRVFCFAGIWHTDCKAQLALQTWEFGVIGAVRGDEVPNHTMSVPRQQYTVHTSPNRVYILRQPSWSSSGRWWLWHFVF